MYPGMTERDSLRSYLLNMPPTNAFGRAFIAVLLNEDDKSPETLDCQKRFSNNKVLIQILTTNWKDTEKEAKYGQTLYLFLFTLLLRKHLFDNVMAAMDDDLQVEAFGKKIVDKKHYVMADDVRLDDVRRYGRDESSLISLPGVVRTSVSRHRFGLSRDHGIQSRSKSL